MTIANFDLTRDTLKRNARFALYDRETVFKPFDDLGAEVQKVRSGKAAIDADRHLTREGKDAALARLGKAAIGAINKQRRALLPGLDADLAQRRASLVSAEKPDPRRVELLLPHILKLDAQERATAYDKASDEQRQLMEAADAFVGPIPTKGPDGLRWRPLLDPATVNASVMERAAATNPDGVARLRELTEIREMHVTLAGIAAAEVREALAGYNLDEQEASR